MKPLRFVVIGMGGYSLAHIQAIEWLEKQSLATLTGVVALEKERSTNAGLIGSLKEKNVVLYKTIDHFFETGTNATDILTVPIGIDMHVPVSIRAMEAGLNIYCEKPIAGTIAEVDQLIAAKNQTNKKIAIGFQHIYSHSIQKLKQHISSGKLGAVRSISLLCGWPRSVQYFSRNSWAGKLKINNTWIYDSPANNAQAHYILNMLYLASPEPDRTAVPVELSAELYRANDIESTDLVQLRFETDSRVKCFVTLTHCNWKELGPIMKITCENAKVTWETNNGKTQISYKDGTTEAFDNLIDEQWRFNGFKDLIEAIQNNREPICTPEIAKPHTMVIAKMHEDCPDIMQIPEEFITELEDSEMYPPYTKARFRRVNHLDEYIQKAYESNFFLSELGIPWAKKRQ